MTKQNTYEIGGVKQSNPQQNRNNKHKSFKNNNSNNFRRQDRFQNQRKSNFQNRGFNNNERRTQWKTKQHKIKKEFGHKFKRQNQNNNQRKSQKQQQSNYNKQRETKRQRIEDKQKDVKIYKKQEIDEKQLVQKVENKSKNDNQSNIKNKEQQKTKRHNRIIIRNLVFDINQKHIRKLLSSYGTIQEVNIPMNPDGKGSRGFAFVQFENRNSSLKAIKQLNGTKYKGRQIILDESVSKQRYLENKVNEEEDNKQEAKKEGVAQNKVKLEEGSSKSKKEKKITGQNQNVNEKKQKMQIEDDQQNNIKDQDNKEQGEGQDQQQKHNLENQVNLKKQFTRTKQQIQKDIQTEVFIRNIPITVQQNQLHKFFRRYGKIKFAKIVINHQTNLSRGTAFIKFHDSQVANKLIEYSRGYQLNILGKYKGFKVDPSINLQLEGTVLKIFPVQTRVDITQKLKGRDQKEKQKEQVERKKKPIKKVKSLEKLIQYDSNDKRNLKLALLGINAISQQMKEKDQQRFRNHYKQKLQKLKNPNNSVSDKRIVFKYLDKDITQKEIRDFCVQYLKQSNNKKKDLTYCKLMLESLQTKKSAGFAFVQFSTHEISKSFLQWLVESKQKLMREPYICQFAIQDSRKIQILQNRKNPKNKKNTNNKSSNNAQEN